MEILFLVLGLVILTVLAMRGVPLLISTLAAGVFVLATARMDIYTGVMETFMPGLAGYVQKYLLIFLFGALFGKVCEISGATDSVAQGIISKFGEKHVMTGIIVAAGVLGFGGVSLFVALFALYPLAMSLFERADIPRKLFPGAYAGGAATFAMTGPFTPSVQNIIPTQYLGTDVSAGAIPGSIVSILLAIAVVVYMNIQVRKCQERGEHFERVEGLVMGEIRTADRMPSVFVSLLPMILLIVSLNVFKIKIELSLLIGILSGIVLYFPHMPKKMSEFWKHVNASNADAVNAIINTSATVGFGVIVASTPGFQSLIEMVTGIGGNPLISAGVATTVLAGIAGSSSGGLGIAVPIVSKFILPMGVDPGALHRVMSIASGGLDSLPHNGFVNTLLGYSKTTHKEGYIHIFWVTVLLPLAELALLIAIYSVIGYMA